MEEAGNAALLFIQRPGSGKSCGDVLGRVKSLCSQSTLGWQTPLSFQQEKTWARWLSSALRWSRENSQ